MPTTALPDRCQFLWQGYATALFDDHLAEATQEFQRDLLIGLHDHFRQLLQDCMQKMSTLWGKAVVNGCIAHQHIAARSSRGSLLQARIWMS
jgi:hypothetical protein